MVYAQDLKSCVAIAACGFESHPRHKKSESLLRQRGVAQLVSTAWPTEYIERGVAQLVECALWEREVVGSNPATPTKLNKNAIILLRAGVAQLARASPFQGEGREFESRLPLQTGITSRFLVFYP